MCSVETESPAQATIRVRVPSWAWQNMELSVNGKSVGQGKPGTYFPLSRVWSSGDTISFTLPARFQAAKYVGADQIPGATRFSLEYGPFLFAVVGTSKVVFDQFNNFQDFIASLEPAAEQPLHYRIRGNAAVTLMPYWQVDKEEFTCFPAIRTVST